MGSRGRGMGRGRWANSTEEGNRKRSKMICCQEKCNSAAG